MFKVIIKIKGGLFFLLKSMIYIGCIHILTPRITRRIIFHRKKSLCRCNSVKDSETWELALNMMWVQYNHKCPSKGLTRIPKSRQRPYGNESRYWKDEGLPPTTARSWMIYASYFSGVKKKQCQYPDFNSTNFISYITLQSYKWEKTIVEKYLEITI